MLLVSQITIGAVAVALPLAILLFCRRLRRASRKAQGPHPLVQYSMDRPKVSRGWPAPQRRVIGPDDDPEFLAQIRVPSPEEKELLSWWEVDLQTHDDDWPRENQN